MTDQLPPHDLTAEQAVLGSLLIDADAIASVSDSLPPDAFYAEQHRVLYRCLLWHWRERIPANYTTIVSNLEKYKRMDAIGGPAYLSTLMNATPTAVYLSYYADIVRDFAHRRAMIDAGSDLVARAYADSLNVDDAVGLVRRSVEPFTPPAGEVSATLNADALGVHTAKVIERWEGRLREHIVPTGIRAIDHAIYGGFRSGELVILGGRPGMGKSAMMLQIAKEAARRTGKIALIASIEMSEEAMRNRMICAEAGIPFWVAYATPDRLMTTTQLTELNDFKERFLGASSRLEDVPIAITDKVRTTDQIRAFAEGMPDRHGAECSVVFIDHLGKLLDSVRDASAEQMTAKRTQMSHQIGKDLGVPVVLLSQLSRAVEAREPYLPSLEHLRYSGSIEQDADYVLLLYRRAYYVAKGKLTADNGLDYVSPSSNQERVELILAKSRNGEVKSIPMGWAPKSMSFTEVQSA